MNATSLCKFLILTAAVFVLAATFISPARAAADTASFSINLPNDDLQNDCNHNPSYCAPYGTITLTLVGNAIHVDITLNPNIIISGAHFDSFYFNTSDHDTAGMAASGLPSGWVCCDSSPSANPFGSFQVALGPKSFGPGSQTGLSFTLTRTSGFTSVSQLISNSCGGNGCTPFMVHILPNCDGCNTGYAGVTETSFTPEPSSMLLIGSGLFGMGGWIRRKKR